MHAGLVLALSLALVGVDSAATVVHDDHIAVAANEPVALQTTSEVASDQRALWGAAIIFVVIVVGLASFFTGYYVGTTAGRSSAVVTRPQQTNEISATRPVTASTTAAITDTTTHIRPAATRPHAQAHDTLIGYRLNFDE